MGKSRNSRGGWVSIASRRAAQREEKPRKNEQRREASQRREEKTSETETANLELLRVVGPMQCEGSAPSRGHHGPDRARADGQRCWRGPGLARVATADLRRLRAGPRAGAQQRCRSGRSHCCRRECGVESRALGKGSNSQASWGSSASRRAARRDEKQRNN